MFVVLRCLLPVVATMILSQSSAFASEVPLTVKADSGSHQSAEAKFCPVWVGQSERLSGRNLTGAALGCLREGKRAEAAFLMIAGQIRLQVDRTTHAPADDVNAMKMEKLFGLVPRSLERTLVEEVFRDPALKSRLYSLLESWRPVFYEGYDPGWEYISHSGVERYREWLRSHTEYRIKTIEQYARKIRSDKFQALQSELYELFRRNGGSVSDGSEDKRRAQQLLNAMNKIADGVEPSLVVPDRSDRFRYEPDSSANFIQRLQGWNGPSSAEVVVFEDEQAVKSSWLAKALSEEALDTLISDVDFEDQILVAFAAGEQEAATGAIYVTGVAYDPRSGGLRVTGKVGVVARDCTVSVTLSYPFAVAAAIKPNGKIIDADLSSESVADGCRAAVAGLAND